MLNNGSQLELVLTKSFTGGLAGEWHHVAVTIENSSGGDIHLYVDGELVNSNLNNNRNGDLQGGVLQVGSQGGGTPGYFDRYIDDVRIWHEALSATDVEAVYASSDALYKATKIVEYGYDAFDRRVVKEIDANGDGAMTDAGDKAHQYIYDGQDIVLAFDKAAALTNRYLHGPAVDQILSDEQYTGGASPTNSAGTTYWPLADNQGSVRQLVTSDGEEAKRINYDSFGQMTVVSGSAVDHIFAYTGREHDAESHLQYNRARYYDAALGRWISEDPIGFAAGDANLSRYVGNGPTNATDPSGLDELDNGIATRNRMNDLMSRRGNCLKGCHDGAKHYGARGAFVDRQGGADLNRMFGQAIEGVLQGNWRDFDDAIDATDFFAELPRSFPGALKDSVLDGSMEDSTRGYWQGLFDKLLPEDLRPDLGPPRHGHWDDYERGRLIGEIVGTIEQAIILFMTVRSLITTIQSIWGGIGVAWGSCSGVSGGAALSISGGAGILDAIIGGAPAVVGKLGLAGILGHQFFQNVQDAFDDGLKKRRNSHLAGDKHPKTDVPFDENGYPDFSAQAKATVKIKQTGTRQGDVDAANKAAGFDETPKGYVWHHHQDGTTMQLVPQGPHAGTGHSGGFKGK